MDRTPVIAGIGLSDYPVAPDLDGVQHHALAIPAGARRLRRREVGHRRLHRRRRQPPDDGRRPGHAGRVPPHRPPVHRRHDDRRLVVRVPRPARAPPPSARGCATRSSSPTGRTSCRAWAACSAPAGSPRGTQKVGGPQAYEAPYGNSLVGSYAMAAQRHMHEFGTTSEQLAEIAVGVREFAGLNPNAMYRDPITVDDVVELAHDRRPAAQARLLRDLRRRRRARS